jgi:hypothetical protein
MNPVHKYLSKKEGRVGCVELLVVDVELARLSSLKAGTLSRSDRASLKLIDRRLREGMTHNDAFEWLATHATPTSEEKDE